MAGVENGIDQLSAGHDRTADYCEAFIPRNGKILRRRRASLQAAAASGMNTVLKGNLRVASGLTPVPTSKEFSGVA